MSRRCKGYCGVACVDGSCPIANFEEYADYDCIVVHNCNECHLYEGCDDCAFNGTTMCVKAEELI